MIILKAIYGTCLSSLAFFYGCFDGPNLPPSSAGGGWFVETNFIPEPGAGPLVVYAPQTTVSGLFVKDGVGAQGSPNEFTVTTDSVAALAAIENGRVPATWKLGWVASLSFPNCDGVTATGTPAVVGGTEEFSCFYTYVVGFSPGFQFSPNPLNIADPPPTSQIVGSGFFSTYGMPIIQYYSLSGTLISQATATSITNNGTVMSAPTPDVSNVPEGGYAGVVSNISSNGSHIVLASVAVTIEDSVPLPPPVPCSHGRCPIQDIKPVRTAPI